jgi:hypothetical protein
VAKSPRGTTLITHNGSNGIFAADCYRYVDDGVFLFIASNTANKSAIQASPDLLRTIFPQAVKP